LYLGAFFVEVCHKRPDTETKALPSERWEAGGFVLRMLDSAGKARPFAFDGGARTESSS
jgi:hypothetical protein